MSYFLIFLFIQTTFFIRIESVRVCPTFELYNDPFSPMCYDYVEGDQLNGTQMFENWGFKVQIYLVTTADGYKISITRVYKTITSSTPLILGHGASMNGNSWLVLGKKSFVYKILQSGRHLFIINFRGSAPSLGHTSLTEHDYNYWNFTLHEMALYDVPATINLVRNVTGEKPIFIGYSMGSTLILIYASTHPEESEQNLKGIITMGTGCYFVNSGPAVKTIARLFSSIRPLLKLIFRGKILAQLPGQLQICSKSPLLFRLLCYDWWSLLTGFNYDGISPEYFPVVALHSLDIVGEFVLAHFTQIMNSGIFRQYDYGTKENVEKYGLPNPPIYNLTKIKLPVAQFLGNNDWATTVKDGYRVDSSLDPSMRCGVKILDNPKWNHLDFVAAKDQQELLAVPVIEKIKQIETGLCKPT